MATYVGSDLSRKPRYGRESRDWVWSSISLSAWREQRKETYGNVSVVHNVPRAEAVRLVGEYAVRDLNTQRL